MPWDPCNYTFFVVMCLQLWVMIKELNRMPDPRPDPEEIEQRFLAELKAALAEFAAGAEREREQATIWAKLLEDLRREYHSDGSYTSRYDTGQSITRESGLSPNVEKRPLRNV
jgi:hypothetical protein